MPGYVFTLRIEPFALVKLAEEQVRGAVPRFDMNPDFGFDRWES
jgi:hypothetical protein